MTSRIPVTLLGNPVLKMMYSAMKNKLFILLVCPALLALTCCSQQPLPNRIVNDNSFTLECDSPLYNSTDSLITFPVAGGSVQFRVVPSATSLAWGMKCDLDDNWCKYTKSVETFSVKAGENTGGQRESFFFVVIGDNQQRINVLQEYIPAIAFETDTVYVKFMGESSITALLKTNIKDNLITYSCDQTWVKNLKFSRSRFTFDVDPNEDPVDRIAKIAVEAESLKDTLVIFQDMFGKEPNPLILPTPIWSPVIDL